MSAPLTAVRLDPKLRALLPYNYADAAIEYIAGQRPAAGRRLFALDLEPVRGEARASAPSFMVDAATLKDPVAMARLLFSIRMGLNDERPADRWFLGPPTNVAETIDLPFVSNTLNVVGAARRVAAIVDAGIAFWDPALRSGSGSRFREMVYLDFDATNANNAPYQRLDQTQIADLCNEADRSGPQSVVQKLGLRFPGSVFGAGGAPADQGWHGTMVADLVAGGLKEHDDDVALFGFELPMSVLRDHGGDSLSAILALTVEMILAATEQLKDLPLVIVLPFGFASGPQDGSHPAMQAVSRLLALSDRKVDLVVPAGNHLQDRCVARFDPVLPASPLPARSVIWRIPPDDFSPNAVELILHGGGSGRVLQITSPGGSSLDVALDVGDLVTIQLDGLTVGLLFRRTDTAAGARVRFVMLGTGVRDDTGSPQIAGDWRIAEGSETAVDLYCLRDDRDRVADKAWPHRAASFADYEYRETDATGALLRTDDGSGPLRRNGTASLLTTIAGAVGVQADERLGGGPVRQAWYSGNRADGVPFECSELVDDGWSLRGMACAANGTAQRARLSGTSAAAALHARRLLGLEPRPADDRLP